MEFLSIAFSTMNRVIGISEALMANDLSLALQFAIDTYLTMCDFASEIEARRTRDNLGLREVFEKRHSESATSSVDQLQFATAAIRETHKLEAGQQLSNTTVIPSTNTALVSQFFRTGGSGSQPAPPSNAVPQTLAPSTQVYPTAPMVSAQSPVSSQPSHDPFVLQQLQQQQQSILRLLLQQHQQQQYPQQQFQRQPQQQFQYPQQQSRQQQQQQQQLWLQ